MDAPYDWNYPGTCSTSDTRYGYPYTYTMAVHSNETTPTSDEGSRSYDAADVDRAGQIQKRVTNPAGRTGKYNCTRCREAKQSVP